MGNIIALLGNGKGNLYAAELSWKISGNYNPVCFLFSEMSKCINILVNVL